MKRIKRKLKLKQKLKMYFMLYLELSNIRKLELSYSYILYIHFYSNVFKDWNNVKYITKPKVPTETFLKSLFNYSSENDK
jgi:hypothetical protein